MAKQDLNEFLDGVVDEIWEQVFRTFLDLKSKFGEHEFVWDKHPKGWLMKFLGTASQWESFGAFSVIKYLPEDDSFVLMPATPASTLDGTPVYDTCLYHGAPGARFAFRELCAQRIEEELRRDLVRLSHRARCHSFCIEGWEPPAPHYLSR